VGAVHFLSGWRTQSLHTVIAGSKQDGADDIDQQVQEEVESFGIGAAALVDDVQSIATAMIFDARKYGDSDVGDQDDSTCCSASPYTEFPSGEVFARLV
jgi:hypothetical protein